MITENLARVRGQVDQACVDAGRDPGEVRLLPVSKTHPASALLECQRAGYSLMGENKVQEIQTKSAALAGSKVRFALIGHLQTNKAKVVAELVDEFQCLDSLRLAAELDKRLAGAGRTLRVLVQVNSSGEPQKSGLPVDEVEAFVDQLGGFSHLDVRGLMTVAVNGTPDEVAACFDRVRVLRDRLRDVRALDHDWDELSMGMSGDFPIAIAEGSTCVRIGTAIFGARDYSV